MTKSSVLKREEKGWPRLGLGRDLPACPAMQLSHYLTLIKPQDHCFQNKLRSLLYKVRASTSSILVRQRHVLWGRYVLFQTQPLNTNACSAPPAYCWLVPPRQNTFTFRQILLN